MKLSYFFLPQILLPVQDVYHRVVTSMQIASREFSRWMASFYRFFSGGHCAHRNGSSRCVMDALITASPESTRSVLVWMKQSCVRAPRRWFAYRVVHNHCRECQVILLVLVWWTIQISDWSRTAYILPRLFYKVQRRGFEISVRILRSPYNTIAFTPSRAGRCHRFACRDRLDHPTHR